MEFFLCNKRKIAVELTVRQSSAVPKAFWEKFWNYCILPRHLAGYLVKLLSNHYQTTLSPENLESVSDKGWGLTLSELGLRPFNELGLGLYWVS